MIDDHEGFRLLARRMLEREGYRVIEGVDGADGLRRATGEDPDLVLLDVNLPDASGFDVAVLLRAGDSDVPIILISTHPASDLADRIRASGAVGFIDKADLSPAAIAALLQGPG